MNTEQVQLRRNRDAAAGHLVSTVKDQALHHMKLEATRQSVLDLRLPASHLEEDVKTAMRLFIRNKSERKAFEFHQAEWRSQLIRMNEYELGELLDGPLDEFVFDWTAIETAFELGQHLDACEMKWGHFKSGFDQSTRENMHEAIQNLVAAGADEESLAQLHQDLWFMGDVLGAIEYQWACYVAIGLLWEAQNDMNRTTGLIRETVPVFRAATAANDRARIASYEVIVRVSRSTSEG